MLPVLSSGSLSMTGISVSEVMGSEGNLDSSVELSEAEYIQLMEYVLPQEVLKEDGWGLAGEVEPTKGPKDEALLLCDYHVYAYHL